MLGGQFLPLGLQSLGNSKLAQALDIVIYSGLILHIKHSLIVERCFIVRNESLHFLDGLAAVFDGVRFILNGRLKGLHLIHLVGNGIGGSLVDTLHNILLLGKLGKGFLLLFELGIGLFELGGIFIGALGERIKGDKKAGGCGSHNYVWILQGCKIESSLGCCCRTDSRS